MSLDYYLHTKDSELAFKLLPRVAMDGDNCEFVTHICQISTGYKPVFESHGCYKSFTELVSMLTSSQYKFDIKDSYGLVIASNDFITHMTRLQSVGKHHESLPNSYCDDNDFMFLNDAFGLMKGELNE